MKNKLLVILTLLGFSFFTLPTPPTKDLWKSSFKLPEEDYSWSPVLGALFALNGEIASLIYDCKAHNSWTVMPEHLSHEQEVAHRLFKLADNKLERTTSPRNPTLGISITLAIDLAQRLYKGTLFEKIKKPNGLDFLILHDEFEKKCWENYKFLTLHNPNTIKKESDFRNELRRLFKEMESCNRTLLKTMILALVYMESQSRDDLNTYAIAMGAPPLIELSEKDTVEITAPLSFSNPLADYNPIEWIELLTIKMGAKHNYEELITPFLRQSYKGSPITPFCVEQSVQTIINFLLYNPRTKTLDYSLLPESLYTSKEFSTSLFAEFLKKHNDPYIKNYYQQSSTDFVNLVSDRSADGILYSKKNYELASSSENILTVLNSLFAIKTTTFEELSKALSTPAHRISIKKINSNLDINVIDSSIPEKPFELKGFVDIGPLHSFFQSIDSYELSNELEKVIEHVVTSLTSFMHLKISDFLKLKSNYVAFIYSKWLHDYHASGNQAEEMYNFFKKNNVASYDMTRNFNDFQAGFYWSIPFYAAARKDAHLISVLTKYNVSLNNKNSLGLPPIYYAYQDISPLSLPLIKEIIITFVDKKLSINPIINGAHIDTHFPSILWYLQFVNKKPEYEIALKNQHSVNENNNFPLIQATIDNDISLLQYFVDFHADLSVTDSLGNTALYYAKTVEVIEVLYHSDHLKKNNAGQYAFEFALENNYTTETVARLKSLYEAAK